jgi:hypothetical protein
LFALPEPSKANQNPVAILSQPVDADVDFVSSNFYLFI